MSYSDSVYQEPGYQKYPDHSYRGYDQRWAATSGYGGGHGGGYGGSSLCLPLPSLCGLLGLAALVAAVAAAAVAISMLLMGMSTSAMDGKLD